MYYMQIELIYGCRKILNKYYHMYLTILTFFEHLKNGTTNEKIQRHFCKL
jgi:hypothetical protein